MEDELDIVSPLVTALLDRLPRAGTEWPLFQRVRWFRALVAVFDLEYDQSDTDLAEEDAHIVVNLLVRADDAEFAKVLHSEEIDFGKKPGAN